MKLISFYNSFLNENVYLLKLENKKDIETHFDYYENNTFREIEEYLKQIKPSHYPVNTALGVSVTSMNRFQDMLGNYKVDLCSNKEKEDLIFFTNMYKNSLSKIYKETVLEVFKENNVVFINKTGAIFLGEIEKEHIEEKEIENPMDAFQEKKYIFQDNSSFLILENDPEPDKWYKKNIKEGFSSILNLRQVMNKNQLEDLLKKYIETGNKRKIFVYTTGNDIEQMKKYIDIAQNLGFEIEIVFNDETLKEKKKKLMEEKKIKYNFV